MQCYKKPESKKKILQKYCKNFDFVIKLALNRYSLRNFTEQNYILFCNILIIAVKHIVGDMQCENKASYRNK